MGTWSHSSDNLYRLWPENILRNPWKYIKVVPFLNEVYPSNYYTSKTITSLISRLHLIIQFSCFFHCHLISPAFSKHLLSNSRWVRRSHIQKLPWPWKHTFYVLLRHLEVFSLVMILDISVVFLEWTISSTNSVPLFLPTSIPPHSTTMEPTICTRHGKSPW